MKSRTSSLTISLVYTSRSGKKYQTRRTTPVLKTLRTPKEIQAYLETVAAKSESVS